MSAVKCLLKVYEHGVEGVVFCAFFYYLFWGEALIDAWHSSQACSCLTMLWRTVMSLFRMIRLKLLLVCDKRVMPRQWLQSHKSPFFGSLKIIPLFHYSGVWLISFIFWKIFQSSFGISFLYSLISSFSTLQSSLCFFSSWQLCLSLYLSEEEHDLIYDPVIFAKPVCLCVCVLACLPANSSPSHQCLPASHWKSKL